MPRATASGKRTSGAAGQRDTRHENGLVGPATAKRVVGKKSQGQLAGASRQPAENGTGPAPPSISLPSNATAASSHTITNGASKAFHGGHVDASAVADPRSVNNVSRRGSGGTYSEETSSESGFSNMGNQHNASVDGSHRQIDVNATKNVDVHRDPGPLELATTVLKSLPIQDTIAILIILMHVPSVSVTFIYAMFTFLTFVPPVTTSSGMNINFAEIFDGNFATPSLVTVVCMDLFFLLFWLFLWQPLQEVILDLAKPVIAITLGGGSGAGRDGTPRGLTTGFFWVLFHHLLRGTQAHWSRLLNHIPESWPIPERLQDALKLGPEAYDTRSGLGWIKSILAVHILTQGVVRYVKEWYLRREKFNAQAGLGDPEAGKAHSGPTDGVSPEVGFTDDPPVQHTPAPPALSKKRRKQSTQIRLQQPLWAALASTKIVVMKEYELSHTTSERAGSNATDVHNLGNAPFEKEPGQIWISYVGSDEVCFNTSHFLDDDDDNTTSTKSQNGGDGIPTSAKHPQKPFYVRVNNAFWQPTRLFPLDDESEENQVLGTRWTGDIYGLRPASKYVCEFVDRRTDEVLFKTSIRTVQEMHHEAEAGSSMLANGQSSLRPDSPATTLKTSIEAAEIKLNEEKNKLKSCRKESKSRINALKKDIETTDHQLSTAGNSDEKFRQKSRQQEIQKAQAERDTEVLADQLKNFDAAPELVERRKRLEKQYASQKTVYDAAKKEHEDFKAKLDKDVKAKEVEETNLSSRVNKVRTRISKVETELANITDANNRGLDEEQRRKQERTTWEEQAAAIEGNYHERIMQAQGNNAMKMEQVRAAEAQLAAVVSGMPLDLGGMPDMFVGPLGPTHQQPAGAWNPNPAAPPHVPSGLWANSTAELMPSINSIAGGPSGTWRPPPTAPPFEPARMVRTRGRSSSMLSDISGFTQSSNEEGSPMPDPSLTWQSFGAIGNSNGYGYGYGHGPGNGNANSSSGGSGNSSGPTSPIA